MLNKVGFIVFIALVAADQALADSVTKCLDAAGKVTFVQGPCPDASVGSQSMSVDNAAPSGSSAPTQMADPLGPAVPAAAPSGFTEAGQPPVQPAQPADTSDSDSSSSYYDQEPLPNRDDLQPRQQLYIDNRINTPRR